MSTTAPGPLAPLVAFGRDLRERGLPVGTGRILTFARAVAALGLTDRESLYWAGRATMIGRKEDFAAYDEAFAEWYAGLITQGELRVELNLPNLGAKRTADWGEQPDDLEVTVGGVAAQWRSAGDDEPEDDDETSIRIVASGVEVLREKSFPDLT
jgi:uncharacterized protein